ncbi:RNA polymerase sigma factor [Pedobacter endophyticus]|uniref:RNA polymerase sigma factor n=1 Tax=Pedobacter endophyticus TaxID=2789740 RepID=A0A7S9KY40_9SPHI|nr:RNA polymerase sigma factor [Pedobacter endophyticus]QPH38955.1 RNA polymerase sigma factor [Pedobacter endophyticus]
MTSSQFTTLIHEQTLELEAYAIKFTNDLDDAKDLLQDTILKAIRFYGKFEEGTNLKGWLYIIMKNTFINNYRKNIKTQLIVTQEDEISYANLMRSATKNGSETTFVLGDIKGALAKLPVHLSIPFVRYVEGYKYHEIAEELNIPLGTVKTRIHEARKQLARMLKMYKQRMN